MEVTRASENTHAARRPLVARLPVLPLSARLAALGMVGLLPYVYAVYLGDLRAHTGEFLLAFGAAFAVYAGATVTALRHKDESGRGVLAVVFTFALANHALLLTTSPTLSDDMYRYLWDGRVQAAGVNPYAYAPAAPELAGLRDDHVWPRINRKEAVTVYPAGAQLAFAALWQVRPDDVRWFQLAMSAGALVAGGLLVLLLRGLARPSHLVLIYLWHPLLAFETAQAAHLDGLLLPLVVGALLARARGRDTVTGGLLGAAAAVKLYPLLLWPALWRWRDARGRLAGPVGLLVGAGVFGGLYLPYLSVGADALGYLPDYFGERFNPGLAALVAGLAERAGMPADLAVNGLLGVALTLCALWLVGRPAASAEEALRRCIWPIGLFTLLTHNLFAWYLLWLLPLPALFLGRGGGWPRVDAWTGWWLFSGGVALSYAYFIGWKPVLWATLAQYVPLYLLLLAAGVAGWKGARRGQ